MHFLQVSGISKQQGNVWVLKDIYFTQKSFQKIAIAGETGSGKSTLLKIIAGLEKPDSGIVFFEGIKVIGPHETLIPGHPGIAYLSQHYELRNNYRMEELLEYANKLPGNEAEKLFEVCRISHLLKRKNDQLSGGEKQRIALARLLVGSPRLLLLDEPFSNLDPIHKNILKSVLHDIGESLKITCILTSHDPLDTLSWADEIMVMKEGQIIQKDSPENIYHKPQTEYTAGLFGSYNLLNTHEAAIYPSLPVTGNLKQVFLRPEQFRIGTDKNHSVKGSIEKISFWGTYYELEVFVGGKRMIVKTMDGDFIQGDIVDLSVIPDKIWHL